LTQEIHFAAITARDGCADVIFVHGLTGEAVGTWTSQGATEPEGEYWPKWLSTDLPNLSFYTLGYPASIFAQWAKKEMALYERAKNSLELLAGYDFGKRPIIFICHSLGGLLTKQLLRTAKESVDAGWQRIADSCVGILFLATPHTGSSLAKLLKAFSGPFSSTHIDKLLKDSSELDELNESFRAFCYRRQIDVFSYYEKYKTLQAAIIVDKASADPGVNGMGPVPVDANHVDISKPSSRHSFVYLSVFRRLEALQARLGHIASAGAFEADDLHEANVLDR
jgi:predicted alpha/beta hydrolase family esterase